MYAIGAYDANSVEQIPGLFLAALSRSPLHHPAIRSGHHQTRYPAGAAKAVTGGRTGRLGGVEEVVQVEEGSSF
jgi:hypothetical protein